MLYLTLSSFCLLSCFLTSSNEHSAYVTFKDPQGAETAVLLSVGSLLFPLTLFLFIIVLLYTFN